MPCRQTKISQFVTVEVRVWLRNFGVGAPAIKLHGHRLFGDPLLREIQNTHRVQAPPPPREPRPTATAARSWRMGRPVQADAVPHFSNRPGRSSNRPAARSSCRRRTLDRGRSLCDPTGIPDRSARRPPCSIAVPAPEGLRPSAEGRERTSGLRYFPRAGAAGFIT